MKTYKVTIIPYLNKDLKFKLENGQDAYPLYFRVTYMRQTTLIRSLNEKRYSDLNVENEEIKLEIKELGNLILFLSDCNTQPFNLNGLKDKYLLSQQPLIQAFDTLFRNQVRKNLEKIKDPILVTLNIGEYSPKYPLNLLLEAVNMFYRKHTEKLFGNCFYYIEMVAVWKDYYPIIDENQPRIIEFLEINPDLMDKGFREFLVKKFKDRRKAKEFYLKLNVEITKYLLQDF